MHCFEECSKRKSKFQLLKIQFETAETIKDKFIILHIFAVFQDIRAKHLCQIVNRIINKECLNKKEQQ